MALMVEFKVKEEAHIRVYLGRKEKNLQRGVTKIKDAFLFVDCIII